MSSSSSSGQLTQPIVPVRRVDVRKLLLISGMFLLGVVVGVGGVLFYILSVEQDRPPISASPVVTTPTSTSGIVIQISNAYITALVRKSIETAGLPGTVKNIQVKLVHNGPITVTGDDQLSFLGVSITKHFALQVQPLVNGCQLEVHVVHADMDGIPITQFVSTFESQIDQQLRVDPSTLPKGFKYCLTEVHTEPQGIFATYSATPT